MQVVDEWGYWFAPTYPRNEAGWILFPDDVVKRKSLFPSQVIKHYAKMQLYLEEELIKYISKEGDIILDPMAGTGTIMLAALMGRNVICIDIEEGYTKMELEVLEHLKQNNPNMSHVIILYGNCKLMLPIHCNHIIFSPPYASALKPTKKLSKFIEDKYRLDEEQYQMYAQTTGNVGLVNTFLYNQTMEKVYNLCYQSLPVGGTMSVVTKDIIEKGERVYLSNWIIKVCIKAGFEVQDWFKHEMMGGAFQDVRRSKGDETVDDEDCIIFRRVK